MKNMKKKMLCGLAALAVAAMPMSALATTNSGVYDGFGYSVSATNNYNSGSGNGRYNSSAKSLALTVTFQCYDYNGTHRSRTANRSGTTALSATTGTVDNVDQAHKQTNSSLYIAGTTFTAQAGSL